MCVDFATKFIIFYQHSVDCWRHGRAEQMSSKEYLISFSQIRLAGATSSDDSSMYTCVCAEITKGSRGTLERVVIQGGRRANSMEEECIRHCNITHQDSLTESFEDER